MRHTKKNKTHTQLLYHIKILLWMMEIPFISCFFLFVHLFRSFSHSVCILSLLFIYLFRTRLQCGTWTGDQICNTVLLCYVTHMHSPESDRFLPIRTKQQQIPLLSLRHSFFVLSLYLFVCTSEKKLRIISTQCACSKMAAAQCRRNISF